MAEYVSEQSKKDVSAKTASKLRNMLRNIDFINADAAKSRGALSAKQRIMRLLDENTFVEIGAFVKKNNLDKDDFSEIICGYGAIDGRLVFVFSQDFDRNMTCVNEFYIKKISALYDMAMKNGAPVIGIFDSIGEGTEEFNDITSLSGYGKIMKAVSAASGIIPQIALITGECNNSFSVIASMFDFVVGVKSDNFLFDDIVTFAEDNEYTMLMRAQNLINRLPQNNADGTVHIKSDASLNRLLDKDDFDKNYDIRNIINKISDYNDFLELYANYGTESVVGFIFLGGTVVGVAANDHNVNDGILTSSAAKKISKFVCFCDNFNIPLLTVLDSAGIEKSKGAYSAFAELACAVSSSVNAKVSVVFGKADSISFTLMGEKTLGFDISYILEESNADAYTEDDTQIEKITEIEAARFGETDDIVEFAELRKKICAAFEMLSSKSNLPLSKKH